MPNFTGKSGGGPHHMKGGYGTGKNPIMNLGFIKSETLKKNPNAKTMMVDGKEMPIKEGPQMKDKKGTMSYKYKKGSMAPKRKPMKEKSRAEQKAIYASGYKG
tara:strand:+ start:59 stop:367 length:309 start_codon:yes stop_codon:yes gene_type:complete